MGKLLDSLRAEQTTTQTDTRKHKRDFLLHKADIAEALRDGWAVKHIWKRMTNEGMTTMSYNNLCQLVQKHIKSPKTAEDDTPSESNKSPILPSSFDNKPQKNTATTTFRQPERELTDEEQREQLREEAFATSKPKTPDGPRIRQPKSKEDELREIFGEAP